MIYRLIYFSKGGLTHDEVYHMPVYLRNFYDKQLTEMMKLEAGAHKKARNVKTPLTPNILRKRK